LPGKIFSGDDHAGLAATCLTAGSKNVIGSLWQMADEASEKLFVLFYEQLLVTSNPLQALVAAQRQFVQEKRPLTWWGGVQIIGRGM
jgi:CHAT domain-containing protein